MTRRFVKSPCLLWRMVKPRLLLMLMMLFCWDSNIVRATYHPGHNLRLRAPKSLTGDIQDAMDSGNAPMDDSTVIVGPFVGNAEAVVHEPRKKKECGTTGMAPITARGLVGPSLKRSYFANTPEEVEEKMKSIDGREKREVKRNENPGSVTLPWACETKYEWTDMGSDHYPRFVRTAECKSRSCFNGFFRCRPRRYKTKVLKRITGGETDPECEDDNDVSLPESLRTTWRFITVTINLCCDCTGRMPGTSELS